MKHKKTLLVLWMLLAWLPPLWSQWEVNESVLSRHTWYKIGVTEDGVYALDRAAFDAMGIPVQTLDPRHFRLYGNLTGPLPETNDAERYDDLTEIPIQVEGEADGSFDTHDRILFYGHGPVNMILNSSDYYNYERNPYTDTTFYFLCLDAEEPGLRMESNPTVTTSTSDALLSTYPDYVYHESDEMSPFASGRTWYGDMIAKDDDHKEFVFHIPHIHVARILRIHSEVLGRCTSDFTYSLRINDNLLLDNVTINKIQSSDNYYGHPHVVDKMFFTDTDWLPVRYELGNTTANPLLFIDFFVINCWRDLIYEGEEMAFRFIPSQMVSEKVGALIRGVSDDVVCWDVSNPLSPKVQPIDFQYGNGFFGFTEHEERRYHLFEQKDLRHVASCYPIENQNLHGIVNTQYLIITPRVFWEASEALADYHREEGLDCQVVDIQQVYNEFGTGTADPTALRDFIRMVYQRSEGALKYVLLMGKGTHDYRDLKGVGNNFVPTYQIAEMPYHRVSSICADDYFALMDPNEGKNCDGKVDIGLGRLPVATVEQSLGVVEKIKHYADVAATHGPWKNDHLFVTDNDQRSYVEYAEMLDRILDTAWPVATSKKLYFDSYPVVATPSGVRIPEAHQALMDCFDKGFLVMSYTGHGGTNGLTDEKVFTLSDVLSLRNYDQLPFLHTATCEFSEFDNPTVTSAGELMMTSPTGGAIAMITTVRPTQAIHNQYLSKSFHEHLFDLEEGTMMRFGDIYRRAKSDTKYYKKNNIAFVFFGDPALRMAYPERRVKTTEINGDPHLSETIVAPSTLLQLAGQVLGKDGQIDASFNGVMNVRLYDKKSTHTTLGNYSLSMSYSFHEDLLYEGKVSVANGRFNMECFLPSGVNFETGNARVCYYAYDSLRKVDANGVLDNLVILYSDPPSVIDNQGPDIQLYWNTPEFQSGDVVMRNGVLYADLFDEHGIDHYNVSIGRNIVMHSSLPEFDNLILDSQFEPALDDYQKGRIAIPIHDLENGTHEFTLKAWDTQNNSSEVRMVMVVEEGNLLTAAYNFPNPFHGTTYFVVGHSDLTENLTVRIEIFDLLGRQVTDMEVLTSSQGGVVPPIEWNAANLAGGPLRPGVYVYRMTVSNEAGISKTVTNRIILQ